MTKHSIALALTATFCCMNVVAQPTSVGTEDKLALPLGQATDEAKELDDRLLQLLTGGADRSKPPSKPGSGSGYKPGCSKAKLCRS